MKMDFDLKLQQTQKLIMTPELKQAIEILQLNAIELNSLIENEIETNPVLEKDDTHDENDIYELYKYIKGFNDENIYGYNRDDEEKDEITYENFVSLKPTMVEHLLFQLHITPVSKKMEKICEYVIFSLSPSGYLKENINDIAEYLGCSEKDVLKALEIIQSFDPPGIGARDLKECLKLQLTASGKYDGLVKELIENHLNEIAENKYASLSKMLNVNITEIQSAVDLIKKLNPKPGSNFASNNDVKYIVPDVYVVKRNGEYVVIVNDSLFPRLRFNSHYQSILENINDEDAKRYVSSKLQSAMWLMKSIESRRETLYKVVKAIVDFQVDFFDKGIGYLRPMTQKQVADIVGIHESTVSRAANGKYVETPRGLFEIKYFFQSGISNKNGHELSSESIKNLIKKLIEEENPKKPLSDQKIADILNEKNINISRRTVTKYREELSIASTSKRKRY